MSTIPFGKHAGMDIEDIPSPYLRWLVCQDWFEKQYAHLIKEIDEELSYRDTWKNHF